MDQSKEHILALKVMRLTKPHFVTNQSILVEPENHPASSLLDTNMNTVNDCPAVGLGEMLSLPQTFGNIFLGETFSSYINVHNDGDQTCRDVVVKADLQTSTQRLPLTAGNVEPVAQLGPDLSIDDVIHHEVKELGTHILVCSVSYTLSSTMEKFYFRKFFKFQVLKPLDVKTKFFTTETDEVFMEAQIQNITPAPIYLERVVLEPTVNLKSAEFNAVGGRENSIEALRTRLEGGESVHGSVNCLKPMDIRQFLYCLTPRLETTIKAPPNQVGKLDITWRSQMGERGRLQTSPLTRVAPVYDDVRLAVCYVPVEVRVEQPFALICKLTNCSERNLDLVLHLRSPSSPHVGLLWTGLSGRQLGPLGPGASIDMNLALIPTSPGLHTISGICVTDTFLKRDYEHDDIVQVLVVA